MAITLSHGGPTMYHSTAPAAQVLVGTIHGVVCMQRNSAGAGWHVAYQALAEKHIHALLIEPDSGTIFAGVNHDTVFASRDGGHTWERRDHGITEHDVYSLGCTRLAGGPRLFAGTEPAHLFYSDDLGQHWTELPALRAVDTSHWSFPAPPHIAHTKHINFHPHDAHTLFIGVEQGGLLKSTDDGHTFQVVTGMDDDVHRTVINPLNPDQIYITTGVGMYASSDGGKTWEQRTDLQHEIGGYPDLLVLHPRQPELLFVASAQKGPGPHSAGQAVAAGIRGQSGGRHAPGGKAGSRISKSSDGGRTWEAVQYGFSGRLRTAFEALCLEDWGTSFSLFGATATGEVWCSDDGGVHWSEVINGLAPISKGNHYAAFVAA